MQIYDLMCSVCGTRLGFVETMDDEGYTLILVDPCPVCGQDEEARDIEELIRDYLDKQSNQ